MPTGKRIKFKVYEGPSLVASFAAIVAEFENPFPTALSSTEISRLQDKLFPSLAQLSVPLAADALDFADLVAALTKAWRKHLGLNTLPSQVTFLDKTRTRITVGFEDLDTTKNALLIAIEMAKAIYARASGAAVDTRKVSQKIQQILSQTRGCLAGDFTQTLLRLSGAREIPVYPVCQPGGFFMCGQGAKGFQFWDTVNHHDSLTGWWLSENKAVTAHFLRRLGFPSVEHQIAADGAAAIRIAKEMGFPVVVKPADRNYGTAVAVGISTDDELQAAYEQARAASPSGQVLVERPVPGDDHRLSVHGGKLIRVSRQLPPFIVGDGERSVTELIEAANRDRRDDPTAKSYCPRLTIDADMTALVHKQGFTLEDRPPHGHRLLLRSTSNLHTGGSRELVTASIHPDNIAMAETIAKNFHLDSVGIDFITPDIGKAWHEIECAIVEVNGNPGVTHEALVERILLDKFPLGSDARIPTFLIVGGDPKLIDSVVRRVHACDRRVGATNSRLTQVAGQRRFQGTADLPARILSLLLDSTCEALVVSCTQDEIAEHGLPHTRYDLALIATSERLDEDMHRLIGNNSSQIVDQVTLETLEEAMRPSMMKMANKP